MVKSVYTRKAAKPLGHSSQSVEAYSMIFIAGTMGVNPNTDEVVKGGIDMEMPVLIENLTQSMKHSFTSWSNVLKFTIYLTNIDDFDKVNEYLKEVLGETKPIFTVVEVSRLIRKEASVCIDGIISSF